MLLYLLYCLFALNFRAAPKEQPQEAVTPSDDADDDSTSFADIKDPDDYRAIFQPKHKIGEKTRGDQDSST